jgi:hypothetical protein
MFEEMPEPDFPEFLAAFWAEKGWSTSVQANEDGTYLVGGDKDDGTRGLIGVRPGGDTEIGASEVEDFAAFCDRKGVDVRVMATRGRFTTGARSAADAGDVHLLDPNELASSVREENAEHLVAEHTGSDCGGSLLSSLPSPLLPLPSGIPSGIPVVPLVVAAVVVFAAVFAGGTVLSSVPFVGGGDAADAGAEPAVTAFSLADDDNSTGTAKWDARVQERVVTANNTYEPDDGKTFVVVQVNVSAGDSAVTLRNEHLALSANGTNYASQPLANVSQQFRGKLLPLRAEAGQSQRAVVVFSVPEGVESATLVERAAGPGLHFERTTLEFDVEA